MIISLLFTESAEREGMVPVVAIIGTLSPFIIVVFIIVIVTIISYISIHHYKQTKPVEKKDEDKNVPIAPENLWMLFNEISGKES